MTVTVRLFAILRERAGRDSVEVELDDGATVADALAVLGREPGLADVIERMPVRMAVNRDYAEAGTPLSPGDELALVPPVSGGATGDDGPATAVIQARVSDQPISVEVLARAVSRPAAGAIVIFQGTTRDVERLDYEAYVEMAEERIAAILRDCVEEHSLEAVAAVHRIGEVPLGEASVAIAVSAAHREEAFTGARAAIDRVKAEAPIWKREIEGGERRWVKGSPPPTRETEGAT